MLRRELPLWLNLPEIRPLVLAAAHPHAANPGLGAAAAAARAMTPFGARLRALRAERGVTLQRLAGELQVSAAYLSALEHGKRGAPSAGLVHQVNEFFGLIWDDAEELARLARLSHPRVTVNTAGLTPEQTALANRLAQTSIGCRRRPWRRCTRCWIRRHRSQAATAAGGGAGAAGIARDHPRRNRQRA